MEGDADRNDLRFRLDWPEGELPESASGDELGDFTFEWDDQPAEVTLAQSAVPQVAPVEPAEPAPDVFEAIVPDVTPEPEFAPVPEVYDAPFYDETDTLDTVRRVLNEHNDALVQLSDAVSQLAANVRNLIEQDRASSPLDVPDQEAASSIAATAMVTLGAEVTGAVEKLAGDLTEKFDASRAELQALMDDVVAAASSGGADARMTVEIDRLRSEVQALKRRLPVRAKELDVSEVAEQVAETVLAVLAADKAPAKPRRTEAPAPAPRRRAAAPAEGPPAKAARPVRRRAAALPDEDDDAGVSDYPVAAAKRASRQRPLRAD